MKDSPRKVIVTFEVRTPEQEKILEAVRRLPGYVTEHEVVPGKPQPPKAA